MMNGKSQQVVQIQQKSACFLATGDSKCILQNINKSEITLKKCLRKIFEGWVLYGEIFSKRVIKLRNDMDSQLVSGTHKKLAEFCQKRNITDIVFNTCENINQSLLCLKNLLKCAGMVKISESTTSR